MEQEGEGERGRARERETCRNKQREKGLPSVLLGGNTSSLVGILLSLGTRSLTRGGIRLGLGLSPQVLENRLPQGSDLLVSHLLKHLLHDRVVALLGLGLELLQHLGWRPVFLFEQRNEPLLQKRGDSVLGDVECLAVFSALREVPLQNHSLMVLGQSLWRTHR